MAEQKKEKFRSDPEKQEVTGTIKTYRIIFRQVRWHKGLFLSTIQRAILFVQCLVRK